MGLKEKDAMGTNAADKLMSARRTYAALSARAVEVYAVLETLRSYELRIECPALVHEVANAVFYSAAYDASERYSSLEEFEEELRNELDEVLPLQVAVGGPFYVVRPYFNDRNLIEHIPGSKAHALMNMFYWRAEFGRLNLERYIVSLAGPISGVSDEEIGVLAEDYHRRSLEVVNVLRTLDTACASANTRFARVSPDSMGVTPEAFASLTRLGELVTLPGLPPAARWFGTDADKINPLSALPENFSL